MNPGVLFEGHQLDGFFLWASNPSGFPWGNPCHEPLSFPASLARRQRDAGSESLEGNHQLDGISWAEPPLIPCRNSFKGLERKKKQKQKKQRGKTNEKTNSRSVQDPGAKCSRHLTRRDGGMPLPRLGSAERSGGIRQ